MKRFLLAISLLCGITTYAAAQAKIDTLYYSKDRKAAPDKSIADFYRIAYYPANSSRAKIFKDFHISGELLASGKFISIDADDDANSIFDGECTSYFNNGKASYVRSYKDGLLDGKFFTYKEDGLVKTSGNYLNGKLTGIYTEFLDDLTFIQIEYKDGVPTSDYYIKGDANGNLTKFRLSDNSPIWESPSVAERTIDYKDGTPWQVYFKNGVMIALTHKRVNDYGKWHKIDMVISNSTLTPIVFQPEDNISAKSKNAKGITSELEVWSAERYIKKVNRAQIFATIMLGVASEIASSNAGHSSSVSHTKYSGRGPGGHNSGYATTYTRSYNAAAAYQSKVLSHLALIDFSRALSHQKDIKELGYLKTNTIHPGESISGYVHIKRIKGETVKFVVDINGAKYDFDWYFGKKKKK